MDPRAFELLRIGLMLDQYFEPSADERLRHLHGDLVLRSHRERAPLLLDPISDLAGHLTSAGAFLLRIGEHAQSLESGFPDEVEQRFEARLGLARKTDNESSAQRDARNTGANPADKVHDVLLRSLAPHPFQHVLMNMLEGNIDVARDLRALD